ncbi:hypothetical protein K493DRAFT_303132 [Basidiobolus meristosporus CBS 931.73]|uniref:BTB domain-containing protein n=1 Tax=Basidiobolus meristosporus CBS 931.73 TaxID=1314790 RepID=A0A1Y1Y4V8_9FUNG|nr:hypothetical protein K493DRAFT_303132 [Basidiobolus meristosporus CBS 931.73]|eukprot:ORX92766.1 hypothetical protein K493DRAFT_303132 [Basidiobolus meristosporus CBS 931.73]
MFVTTKNAQLCMGMHPSWCAPQSQVPLKSWAVIQDNPTLRESHIRVSETHAIPRVYVTKNLRQMASILFNNPFSTQTHLHVVDRNGKSAEFWVHDFYFTQDSRVLWDLLRKPTSPPIQLSSGQNTAEVNHVHLNVSCVDSFAQLLRWIYTRDDDAWLRSLNEENFEAAMDCVALLRLSQEAYYVLARFYEAM